MKKKISKYLGELVYGAIDGTVTTFAVVAGAAGAGLSPVIIIILGIANLVGDGFSMGASAYLSAKSKRDLKIKEGRNSDENPIAEGVATFSSFIVVGFIPVLVYVLNQALSLDMSFNSLFVASSIVTAITFLLIGVLKAYVTKTNAVKDAIETLILGAIAAGLAYLLGDFLAGLLGA